MVEIIKRLSVGALSQMKEADMPEILEWRVIRPHDGDRWYNEGDIRIGSKNELGHLSPKTLVLIEENSKAEDEPLENKAEGAAQANKAAPGRQAKQRPEGQKGEQS